MPSLLEISIVLLLTALVFSIARAHNMHRYEYFLAGWLVAAVGGLSFLTHLAKTCGG